MMLNYNPLNWVPYLLQLLAMLRFGEIYWCLRHIPGPRLAAFTDLWRLIAVWSGRAETTYVDLHKEIRRPSSRGPEQCPHIETRCHFKVSMASAKSSSSYAKRRLAEMANTGNSPASTL